MDEDDLPPPPAKPRDDGFSGALGATVARFVWIGVFVAVVAAVLYAVTHWL
jgi:hypothetical protein